VVTDGSNGGYYWENGMAVHYDSVKVKAVDTNGAGDTFHGAFIAAYCEGKSTQDCCVFASKVAAYKCMHTGARTYELNKNIAENL
jgi:sulfofructose kinase